MLEQKKRGEPEAHPFSGRVLARRVILDDELDVTLNRHLSALRATDQTRFKLLERYLEVRRNGRKYVAVDTNRGILEERRGFGTFLDVDELTWLHSERGTVDKLSVYENVAVNNHLTSLSCRSSETGAEHERVKTHLEEFHQVFTGESLGASCLVKGVAHLLFADAELCAKTLLLTQTERVVALRLTLCAAVLTGRERALAHQSSGLGGKCDT
jgi:hypothetical protein